MRILIRRENGNEYVWKDANYHDELNCLSNHSGVVGITILVILCVNQSLNLEESVLEVVVVGLEAVLQIGAYMEALGAENNVAVVLMRPVHAVLLAEADHVLVGALVGINPNPVAVDCLEVRRVNLVLLADLVGVDVLKDLDGHVVSVVLTVEDLNDLGLGEDGIAANGVLGISGGKRANDSVDGHHSSKFLSFVKNSFFYFLGRCLGTLRDWLRLIQPKGTTSFHFIYIKRAFAL